jgi:hypothetical protein
LERKKRPSFQPAVSNLEGRKKEKDMYATSSSSAWKEAELLAKTGKAKLLAEQLEGTAMMRKGVHEAESTVVIRLFYELKSCSRPVPKLA